MAEKQTIEVTIDNDGEMTFETKGFIGKACNDIKKIETMLGNVTSTENTKEMFQSRIPKPVFNGIRN